jgi:tetraacyldisaccharide 4'-kinase
MMKRIADWLEHQWAQRTLWQFVLRPISWLFRLLVTLRRMAYRRGWISSEKLPLPVIIVGNMTVGGSGKTPVVIALIEQLRAAGYVPGVISRGYGGTQRGPFEVGPLSDPTDVGDEPVLIASRTEAPLFIGRDRVAAAKALLETHPNCDVIVSDDGLQHYRLQRDIEIVVVDGESGFANGQLLPAGPLREPLSRLRIVNFIVINKTVDDRAATSVPLASMRGVPADVMDLGQPLSMRLLGQVFYNAKDPNQHALAADLRRSAVHAVAGIGKPQRFFNHLRTLGLNVIEHPFPDHHAFLRNDLEFGPGTVVLMTEKDAVKCRAFAQESWWVLAVSAEIDKRFITHILKKLRPTYGPQTT